MRRLITQFARFGVVGVGGLVIDFVVFNVLRASVLDPAAVDHGQVYAKIVSTSLAIVFNWLGNRHWTFRHSHRDHWMREAAEFVAVSIGGMAISLGCLGFSVYVLQLTSALADNISANVVGLVLGTVFRFTFYRLWVFRGQRAPAVEILGLGLEEDRIGEPAEASDAAPDALSARPSARFRRAPAPVTADGVPPRG
ncbi:MAG: GtrA family protein [Microbacteriaceae bacterium]